MRYSPRNIEIAFSHGGLTHYAGILFFNEFSRMLQLRRFLTRHLRYPRRNQDYQLSQMILSLVYPIILGLDRLETALRIPMKLVSDSDLIPVTCSELKAVVFGAKRRWRSYRA